jgi:putative FmdB family regulatory protein
MPLHEYFVRSCRLKFELMRSMNEALEAASCPSCGSNAQWLPSLFSKSSEGRLV